MDYAFDHVHIICRDLTAMALYFKEVFGAEEIYREDNFHGAPNAVMRLGSARFFLRGVRPGETPGSGAADSVMGLDHFSLAVDDVTAASAELKGRGAEFIREPGAVGMDGRTQPSSGLPRASESNSASARAKPTRGNFRPHISKTAFQWRAKKSFRSRPNRTGVEEPDLLFEGG